MDIEFKQWQNLYIESLKYGSITIFQAITNFINEGLNPFILNHRYLFQINKHQLGDIIATTMFKFSNDTRYLFPTRKGVNFSDDYFQYFEYIINDEEWESFWNYWDRQLDYIFDNDYDSRLTLQLKHIVWMCIDLEKSPVHNEFIEMNRVLDEYELQEDENPYRKIDPYILDQMNSISHPKFIRFEN
jgi:hypothetical protein